MPQFPKVIGRLHMLALAAANGCIENSVRQVVEALLDLSRTELSEAVAKHLLPQLANAPVISFAEEEFFARSGKALDRFPA